MQTEELLYILVLAPDVQSRTWGRTVVIAHPPVCHEIGKRLAMSDEFGEGWVHSHAPLVIRQSISNGIQVEQGTWRTIAYKAGVRSFVRVAVPIAGEHTFECYLLSAKSADDTISAAKMAWSALSIWSTLKEQIAQAICPLTSKELQALALTFKGLSAVEVAHEMTCNERIVTYYIARAMKKLNVSSKLAAVQKAIWMGLI